MNNEKFYVQFGNNKSEEFPSKKEAIEYIINEEKYLKYNLITQGKVYKGVMIPYSREEVYIKGYCIFITTLYKQQIDKKKKEIKESQRSKKLLRKELLAIYNLFKHFEKEGVRYLILSKNGLRSIIYKTNYKGLHLIKPSSKNSEVLKIQLYVEKSDNRKVVIKNPYGSNKPKR